MLTVQETAAALRRFDRVLILTHMRPDGDTVGCAAGLCEALRAWARRHGATYVRARSDEPLEGAVRRFVSRSID